MRDIAGIPRRTAVDEERVAALLRRAETVVLTTHRDPDGDGLGAEAALAEALTTLGVTVHVINDGPVPVQYQFLAGSRTFAAYCAAEHAPCIRAADQVLLLDAARPERTGALAAILAEVQARAIAIDHHPGGGWAPVELIDPAACATTELVQDLLERLAVPLTPAIAEALYTGLVADTQEFRTGNTTPRAHRRAAQLLEAGASVSRVDDALFASWPLARLQLRGAFLAGLRSTAGGRLVWGVVDQRRLQRLRQESAAVEGFVEEALTVAGAELALLFLEEADAVRLSLRARGAVRVDGLARSLGGGGHPQAAGTRLPLPLSRAVRQGLHAARHLLTADDGGGGARAVD